MNTISTYAGQGKLRSNLFAAGRLLLAGTALATGLNAAPINRFDVIVADSQATIYAVSAQTPSRESSASTPPPGSRRFLRKEVSCTIPPALRPMASAPPTSWMGLVAVL